jgi:carbamoyl-phosphate synthase large subunit
MNTLRIAISGLHRGENPQPGAGIIRSLRRACKNLRVIGLVYDAMDSGIYVEDGPDAVFSMPYPTSGGIAYLERLDQVRDREPFDIFIPTLDAELELLVHLESGLAARGITVCIPDARTLARRSKDRLPELAKKCGVPVPETLAVFDVNSAVAAAHGLSYPLMVKGQYYDAKIAHDEAELVAAAGKLLSQWGAPIILQQRITGPEFNAMGIGDGAGNILGLCCLRKTVISDQGKGLGGMTVKDARLEKLCLNIIQELQWRGPFELELMKDEEKGDYCLIEMNPRFPAWVDFPSQFGCNFAAALLELITLDGVTSLPPCAAGWFYLRHQIEVLGQVDNLAALSGEGVWRKPERARPPVTAFSL